MEQSSHSVLPSHLRWKCVAGNSSEQNGRWCALAMFLSDPIDRGEVTFPAAPPLSPDKAAMWHSPTRSRPGPFEPQHAAVDTRPCHCCKEASSASYWLPYGSMSPTSKTPCLTGTTLMDTCLPACLAALITCLLADKPRIVRPKSCHLQIQWPLQV